MKKIIVNLKTRSYPIYIEPGLIKDLSDYLSEYNDGQKWVIISQQNLMGIIGYEFEKNLKTVSILPVLLIVALLSLFSETVRTISSVTFNH